jgi:raffinose/stachyose/melibiose transport system substrate-binding protein
MPRIKGEPHVFRFRLKIARAVVALGAASVLILAGCAGGDSGSTDGGSATAGTIRWWSWTPDNDLAEREIAAFNKQYPDIKVTYKKVPNNDYTAVLRPALASDDGPDVFTVGSGRVGPVDVFGAYAADLTPEVEKLLGADWKSKVYENGVNSFTQDDALVAMPWSKVGAGIMWINKDMFDKDNVKVPTTLDEWKQACQVFRDKGHGCFKEGIGATGFDVDTFHSIANSVEPGLFTKASKGEAKWTEPGLVEAYRIFASLESDGILDKGSVGVQQYPDVNNAFLSGKVPMVQMGSWYAQYSTVNSLTAALAGAGVPKDTPKITIAPISFPDVAGKGNPSTIFTDPDAAQAVNAKSKNLNAATTFALWLGGTTEGQQTVANNVDSLPTLDGIAPAWDSIELVNAKVQRPLLEDLYKRANESTEPRFGLPAVNLQAIADADQAVVSGKMTPEEATASIQQVFDANPIS